MQCQSQTMSLGFKPVLRSSQASALRLQTCRKDSIEMTHFVSFWADFLDCAAEPLTHCQGHEGGSLGDIALASALAAARIAPAFGALTELCRVQLKGCLANPAVLG